MTELLAELMLGLRVVVLLLAPAIARHTNKSNGEAGCAKAIATAHRALLKGNELEARISKLEKKLGGPQTVHPNTPAP